MDQSNSLQTYNRQLTISESSISVYKDEPLDDKRFRKGKELLKIAFPKLSNEWFVLLLNRCIEKGFTAERFRAAVYNTIDNVSYTEPTIAHILKFDSRIEMLTFNEVAEKQKTFGESIWKSYTQVNIEGRPYWTPKENVEKYALQLWEIKQPEPKVHIVKDEEKEAAAWSGFCERVFNNVENGGGIND